MSDASIYALQDFGKTMGFGRRAALLVVDFTVGFNEPALFGGGNINLAVRRTARPVAFSRVVYADDGVDAGVFTLKVPQLRILTESHPAGKIVPELKPVAGELIVRKRSASEARLPLARAQLALIVQRGSVHANSTSSALPCHGRCIPV